MNKSLTRKQRRLLELLRYRERNALPTVQRDLAEALGIRRDSLNKLLARTRQQLEAQGTTLPRPPRRASHRAAVASLSCSLLA